MNINIEHINLFLQLINGAHWLMTDFLHVYKIFTGSVTYMCSRNIAATGVSMLDDGINIVNL